MTTVIFPTIWLSQWVVPSLFEIIIPIWMFQSLFSLSLHYHRLISINCSYFFFSLLFYFYYRFSYTQIWYYLISDTVLNWHFNDLKQNSCPRLFTFCCRCCHSFHFLFVLDIDFEFIFIFILSINDIDVHFLNQSYCCCYSY